MPYEDLREFLESLEERSLLKRVRAEVDKAWELSTVMRWVYLGFPEEERFAVLFENVKGHDIPVVIGAIGASYKTYAVGLDLDPMKPKSEVIRDIRRKWINAMNNVVEPRIVNSGPCKENIIREAELDVHNFPHPVWTPEKDGGSGYITAPYIVSKDPETGIRNVGTYKAMIRDAPNARRNRAWKSLIETANPE